MTSRNSSRFGPSKGANLGLYVHVPFCESKCPYCGFVSYVGEGQVRERYVRAVCGEIEGHAGLRGKGPLDTMYVGGGTPSTLEPELLGRILCVASETLGVAEGAEVTVEANPRSSDRERFEGYRGVGFNRLSLGVQSLSDGVLKALGRTHTAEDGRQALRVAREAGFENVSLDLMFGVPGSSMEEWTASVEAVVGLGPEHVSLYALTLEKGTLFYELNEQGRWGSVSEEEEARCFEMAIERMEKAGYEHYEISNFAKPGRRCRHNWGCWTGAEYLGVGAAAHSFLDGERRWNGPDIGGYVEAVEAGSSPCAGREVIDPVTRRREEIWLGLRHCEGVRLREEDWERLGQDERFAAWVEEGHFVRRGDKLCLSNKGMLLADALCVEIMGILGA